MASKRWLWEQYDRHVMADTLADSSTGADAGIVRVHGTRKAIAITSDCTPRYVAADPYEGGKQAVAEAWRNLTAVGATPIAVTDNLNFGNPQKPEIMGQIVRAIDGMAEACLALNFPVVSGNVSLYNETDGVGIPPTPTIGAVGLLEDYSKRADYGSMTDGDCLLLLGVSHGELGASLYLRECMGRSDGAPPPVDLAAERRVGDFVLGLIAGGVIRTVHDLSDGGLVVAAAEMALASDVGVTLDATSRAHAHIFLFGEDQGRYLISTREPEVVIARALAAHVNVSEVGVAGGQAFASEDLFSIDLDTLRSVHEGWLPALMNATPERIARCRWPRSISRPNSAPPFLAGRWSWRTSPAMATTIKRRSSRLPSSACRASSSTSSSTPR